MFSLLALPLFLVASGDAISIRALSSPRDIEVHLKLDHASAARLRDEDGDLRALLTFSIVDKNRTAAFAIFANYKLRGDSLILRPRYRLSACATYVAQARLPGGTSFEKFYRVPEVPPGPAPRVRQVFPSSPTLPANCLKFYVHFNRTMRQGRDIFEQFQLVDDHGNVVPDPWRRTELWNAEGDRLTLWIHPGRIKQGINLREDYGPVLKPNRRYQLVVTDQVRDLEGVPLAKPYVKEFLAVAEDHKRPDLGQWKLNKVRIGSRDPLVAVLDEPLDQALLLRFVTVSTGTTQISGSVVTGDAENRWTFTPEQPWPDEQVMLNVNGRLEDLAGNTPNRLFDTDLTSDSSIVNPTLQVPVTTTED